jgi:hypothetical protein
MDAPFRWGCIPQSIKIIFIKYAEIQKNGKPNNLKSLAARKPKGLNRIAVINTSSLANCF